MKHNGYGTSVLKGLAVVLVLMGLFSAWPGVASAEGDERWADFFGAQGPNGLVRALAVDGLGNLYVGGDFTLVGDLAANRVAKWDAASGTWSALGSGMDGPVYVLAVDSSGNLYAGGRFGSAGGLTANHVARWDGSAWHALGSGIAVSSYTYVYALAVDATGILYAGGRFNYAGGRSVNNVAKWDGTTWSALGGAVGGVSYPYVDALAVDGSDNLYAGGYSTTAGGKASNHIARWDAPPTAITVTSDADSGPGTLRQAIADIATGGTITFEGDMTIHLASTLTLDRDVTIDGEDHNVVISGDSDGDVMVFSVSGATTASFVNLTIEKGRGTATGGIWNGATVVVTGCTFLNNTAGSGGYTGAIHNSYPNHTLTVADSSFYGNASDENGGAIRVDTGTATVVNSIFVGNSAYYGGALESKGTLTVINSTFSGNNANSGGAIFNEGTPLTIRNSVFARGTSGPNCSGPAGGGNNLSDDGTCPAITDSAGVLLGPLGSYGGRTPTMPLLPRG